MTIEKGEHMTKKNIKDRKVVRLTFVRTKSEDKTEELEITKKMVAISKIIDAKDIREIVMDDNTSEKIRKSGLPELWLHDFQNKDRPIQPFKNYYVVDFDDGSRKVVLILEEMPPPEDCPYHKKEPAGGVPEPQMYQ